jgi:beta-glucosidase
LGRRRLASACLAAASAIDLSNAAKGGMALAVDLLVEEPPSEAVSLALRCGEDCEGRVDITEALRSAPAGEWQTVAIRLGRFAEAGAELTHVTAPFVLETEGTLALRFANVRLEPAAEGE